jgi:hypothetical protein
MFAVALMFVLGGAIAAQNPDTAPKRLGLEADFENYPQATPKEALASVIKAMQRARVEYLLAHLTDPAFVDRRIAFHGGQFQAVVREVSRKLEEDPAARKELIRFLQDGEWDEQDGLATARLKNLPNRQVVFRKQGDRWFLDNTARADRTAPPKKDE